MKESQIEDSKYVVDLKQTFYANIFWGMFILAISGMIMMFINQFDTLENEVNRLIGMMFACFILLKMITWVGHPHLHFKEKP